MNEQSKVIGNFRKNMLIHPSQGIVGSLFERQQGYSPSPTVINLSGHLMIEQHR